MQFKKQALFFYFLLSSSLIFSQDINYDNYFRPPVDIPIYLSGNFGEIRSTHFHAGIDIKTQGVVGKKIYAAAGGYISRIKVSVNSYGKTIYISHPNGYTTVYGHLNQFNPEISKLVKNLQYENNEFEINYFPPPGQLPVKKGDLIGYSGNTGSSLGPHLHFEIRETNQQIPTNPLKFNFNIKDNIPPVLYNLVIYPVGENSTINNKHAKQFFKLKKHADGFALVDTNEITLSGEIGFGIEMYDYLNGSGNRCGIYTLSVFVDSLLTYNHVIDKFSFYETGYVKSHIDYAEKVKSKRTAQKTFIAPNNHLSIYKTTLNRGIYNFNHDSVHHIKIIATDVYDNESVLKFTALSKIERVKKEGQASTKGVFMEWNTENTFEADEIKIDIPANSLFDTIYFTYSKLEPTIQAYSNIHKIHNIYTPLKNGYTLTIKTLNLPPELKSKAFIAQLNNEEIVSAGGDVINGHIVTEATDFGSYVVLVDTVSPNIEPVSDFTKITREIEFLITDDLTGIKSYNGFIDNNWALFEYDQKNDLLFYIIDPERIKKGIEHELELFVIDNRDNISTYYTTFYW